MRPDELKQFFEKEEDISESVQNVLSGILKKLKEAEDITRQEFQSTLDEVCPPSIENIKTRQSIAGVLNGLFSSEKRGKEESVKKTVQQKLQEAGWEAVADCIVEALRGRENAFSNGFATEIATGNYSLGSFAFSGVNLCSQFPKKDYQQMLRKIVLDFGVDLPDNQIPELARIEYREIRIRRTVNEFLEKNDSSKMLCLTNDLDLCCWLEYLASWNGGKKYKGRALLDILEELCPKAKGRIQDQIRPYRPVGAQRVSRISPTTGGKKK